MYRLKIVLTFIIFMIVSCSLDNNEPREESKAIISFLYTNEASIQLPPPPPPSIDTSSESISQVEEEGDSEKIQRLYSNFAITFYDNSLISEDEIVDFPENFKEIVRKSDKTKKTNSYFSFPSSDLKLYDLNGKEIPVVDSPLRLEDVKKKYNVNGVISYSPIYFNKTFDEALLKFGAYRHGLDGSTGIYALKKNNGQWQVIFSKVISES